MVRKVKSLSSLLVFLNDWLNFCVRDQFEIKMLITRGHSDINTTLSVIMSLFCCRSLCLCISLARCLCLLILALSRSACRRFSLQFSLLLLALTLSTCRLSSLKFCLLLLLLTRSHWRSSSLVLRVLNLALCRSPSLCSLLKTCRLHAKISRLLFVDIIAFVSCNKKL